MDRTRSGSGSSSEPEEKEHQQRSSRAKRSRPRLQANGQLANYWQLATDDGRPTCLPPSQSSQSVAWPPTLNLPHHPRAHTPFSSFSSFFLANNPTQSQLYWAQSTPVVGVTLNGQRLWCSVRSTIAVSSLRSVAARRSPSSPPSTDFLSPPLTAEYPTHSLRTLSTPVRSPPDFQLGINSISLSSRTSPPPSATRPAEVQLAGSAL